MSALPDTLIKPDRGDRALMTRLTARSLVILYEKYPATYRKNDIEIAGQDVLRATAFIEAELILSQNAINNALGKGHLLRDGLDLTMSPEAAVVLMHYSLDVSPRYVGEPNVIDVDATIELAQYVQNSFNDPQVDRQLLRALGGYAQMILTRNRILAEAGIDPKAVDQGADR